jgi:hypothetical protein
MTRASGGAGPDADSGRRWEMALSFAGAQRDYVGQVLAALKARRCAASTTLMSRSGWGTNVAEGLLQSYSRESVVVVVVFISADYAGQRS